MVVSREVELARSASWLPEVVDLQPLICLFEMIGQIAWHIPQVCVGHQTLSFSKVIVITLGLRL